MTQVILSNNRDCDPNVGMSTATAESDPNLDARLTRRMKSSNEHRGSVLLKTEENEQVFRLIGNRCQCLAAGVCQLYLTEGPSHREWIKKTCGVITLIKDAARRSFYLRLYCLQRRALVWEHEVYNSMEYKSPLHYFHTFEAEDCMAAFNFASETDAMTLKNILLEKLNASRHRRQDKQRKSEIETPREAATLPRKSPSGLSPMSALVSASSTTLLNGSPSPLTLNKSVSSNFMSKSKKGKKKKKEPKLSKDQISLPTDFRHVTHMGWNPENKGMEFESLDTLDPSLKQMIHDVGISEKKMRRKKMQECIYDFIDSYQQQDMQEKRNDRVPAPDAPSALPQKANAPPPIPVRTIPVNMNSSKTYQTRSAPPLPPLYNQSNVPPPPAPTAPPVQRTLPSRPPPPSNSPGAMLPPPPPPPPLPSIPAVPTRDSGAGDAVSTAPPPPPPPIPIMDNGAKGDAEDHRSQLMESIRSGATLRKINRDELKPVPVVDSRSDLLNQIRQGIELKPVLNEPKASPASAPLTQSGVAGALLRALAERARAIHSDSEDSTTESSDDDDEWDD